MKMWDEVSRATSSSKPLVAARAKRDRARLMLMQALQLRRGSCYKLMMDDLHFEDEPATLTAWEKGKPVKRVFELPALVRDVLRDWLDVRGDEPGPVFLRLDPAAKGPLKGLDGETINRIVGRRSERAGIKQQRAHGLRHYGITRSLELL
jgi:integrase